MIAFAPPPVAVAPCRPAPAGVYVERPGGVRLRVRTIGQGRPVVFIPSFARGVSDFDGLAQALAQRGVMSILPDPRGMGGSAGPQATDLGQLADDAAASAAQLCPGQRVDVVGHAFGNRLARLFAVRHPDQVDRVVLLAGGGEAQMAPEVKQAVADATQQGIKPDAERLKAIQLAFFAKGHDARVWLGGWSPSLAASQRIAGRGTQTSEWWTGGRAPILLVQATEDPVARPANAAILKRDIGPRLTVVMLPHASHAMLPEQPAAIAAVLGAYFNGETDPQRLQRLVDADIRTPAA